MGRGVLVPPVRGCPTRSIRSLRESLPRSCLGPRNPRMLQCWCGPRKKRHPELDQLVALWECIQHHEKLCAARRPAGFNGCMWEFIGRPRHGHRRRPARNWRSGRCPDRRRAVGRGIGHGRWDRWRCDDWRHRGDRVRRCRHGGDEPHGRRGTHWGCQRRRDDRGHFGHRWRIHGRRATNRRDRRRRGRQRRDRRRGRR